MDRLTRLEVVTGFYGLGAHWGAARSQNARGHVVGHVKDLGRDPDSDTVRVYETRIGELGWGWRVGRWMGGKCEVEPEAGWLPAPAPGDCSGCSTVASALAAAARCPCSPAVARGHS